MKDGTCSAACAPGDFGPVTIFVKYRTDDANLGLLLDYSVDGTNNGVMPGGPVTLRPGDTDWHRFEYEAGEVSSWGLNEINGARLFLQAVDVTGLSVVKTVEIDHMLVAGRACGYYCYHPYNVNYATQWPDWRK